MTRVEPGPRSRRAGTLSGFAWGRAIDLAAAEIRDRIDVTMARWGTLSGRVTDEYGDPVQGAGVQLLHVRYDAGQRQLVPADAVMAVTDDLGRYRLHSLTPGQYMVSATVGPVSLEDLPGYTRSYYPGTPNPGEGQFVSVGLSEDDRRRFCPLACKQHVADRFSIHLKRCATGDLF